MQYTTVMLDAHISRCCFIRISKILLYAIHNNADVDRSHACVVLSGFQRYFCMQYTTSYYCCCNWVQLFYQDFKDTFVCNTQHSRGVPSLALCCFIRISKILLYAIHNNGISVLMDIALFYQDFNEQFAAKVLKNHEIYKFTRKYFDTSEKKLLLRLFNSCKSSVNSKIDKIQRCYD